MLSLGLAVIFGMLNVINFTHGAQYMMGAFAAWLMLTVARHPVLGRRWSCRRSSSGCSASCSSDCC